MFEDAKNIASKISCEYVYELLDSPQDVPIQIQAGSGSYRHFRENFYKRLAEVFYNLHWIYDNEDWINANNEPRFDLNEFILYENLLKQLNERYQIPNYVNKIYEKLKKMFQSEGG